MSHRDRMLKAEHWVMEGYRMRRTHVASFEEREPKIQAKKCEWPLDAGRGKETNSPLVSSEESSPPDTLILAQ